MVNFECPHCKAMVELPEDKDVWIAIGEERMVKKFAKLNDSASKIRRTKR